MALYARSDLMSVSVPQTSGGCGAAHARPVTHGAPAKIWKLECPPCENYLRGDKRAKIIKVIPGDRDQGIPARMEHVADSDPHWSSTPEGIPPTPDEQHINKVRAERGAQELQQLQALIAARGAGINIPDNAMWLLQQTFDPRIIKGTVICPNGHENLPGSKFCNECSIRMAGAPEIPAAPDLSMAPDAALSDAPQFAFGQLQLERLHVATLKKKCRDAGLPDKGTKVELIARLSKQAL